MYLKELSSKSNYSAFQEIDILVDTQEATFSMSSLLPLNWGFVQKNGIKLHTDSYRKLIVIPPDYFKSVGNYYSLLHEVGHAFIDETKDFEEIEEEIYLRDKRNHIGSSTFSISERQRYKNLVINSETQAWKYAITKLLELKSLGIDLEPQLSIKDLESVAEKKLQTYLLE